MLCRRRRDAPGRDALQEQLLKPCMHHMHALGWRRSIAPCTCHLGCSAGVSRCVHSVRVYKPIIAYVTAECEHM